jgi:hypothetical protein
MDFSISCVHQSVLCMYVYTRTHVVRMLNCPAYVSWLVKNEISGPIVE